jgi:RNA polymerase sigma factor (sigma-70 family)
MAVPDLRRSWSVSDLGSLYLTQRQSLVTYANRYLNDFGKAEEVVQDAFIKVMLASPDLQGEDHARAYIKKTIENAVLDFFRTEGRRPSLVVIDESLAEKEEQLQSNGDHLGILTAAEDSALVRQALSLLSHSERAAIVMWELEGRSASEIAKELGIKESSVRHTVSRARASMRRVLSEFIIDEKNGLTALDLLSRSYKRSVQLSAKSSKIVLSIILIIFAYFGLSNIIGVSSNLITINKDANVSKATSNLSPALDSKNGKSHAKPRVISPNQRLENLSTANAKATPLVFAGLDKFGAPSGFTITDSTGTLGALFFIGKEAYVTDVGLTIPSLAKTLNGAANIFLNQSISQDVNGEKYDVILSFGRKGAWIPLATRVISSDIERLMDGNYLLTAVIQVKSEVETTISIPASAGGRDLEVPPSRVITRILLNPSKTEILGQAVQVIEKVSSP